MALHLIDLRLPKKYIYINKCYNNIRNVSTKDPEFFFKQRERDTACFDALKYM